MTFDTFLSNLEMTPMKIRTLILFAGMLTMGMHTVVHAQARDGSRAFKHLDANGDGVITKAELGASREKTFDRLDANHDGMISAEERDSARKRAERFRKHERTHDQEALAKADANGDGNLSRDEFMNAPQPIMEKADANHDGEVTRDEFDAFTASVRKDQGTK
jgi:Ca2+-binding EF-hand superfamily protein